MNLDSYYTNKSKTNIEINVLYYIDSVDDAKDFINRFKAQYNKDLVWIDNDNDIAIANEMISYRNTTAMRCNLDKKDMYFVITARLKLALCDNEGGDMSTIVYDKGER